MDRIVAGGLGETSMKSRLLVTILCATTLVLPGCAATKNYINKPWRVGTWGPAALCGIVGAAAGIGIAEAVRGESSGSVTDAQGNVFIRSRKDDADYWKGGVPGGIAGALLCGLIGHAVLDPDRPVPPPPPPPPPSPTPAPSSKRIVLRGVNFDFDK